MNPHKPGTYAGILRYQLEPKHKGKSKMKSPRTFHPGSFVRFVLGKQYDLGAPNETGIVISTGEMERYGQTVQTVVIEYRADLIGADGHIEKLATDVFPMNMTPDHLSTGRVGRGTEIHIMSRYNVRCGSGNNTTGSRKRYQGMIENKPVTCQKCLKEMENNPELKARVTRQLIYANTGKFWEALGDFLAQTTVDYLY